MNKNSYKNKNSSIFDRLFVAFISVLLIAYTILIFILIAWAILTSLKSEIDYGWLGNVVGLPSIKNSKNELLFNNYRLIIENLKVYTVLSYDSALIGNVSKQVLSNFWALLVNTLLYAVVGAVILAGVPCIMAYMCSKYKNKASTIIYFGVIIVMAMPVVGSYVTDIMILRTLGLYDTWIGNWIQKFNFTGMYFLVYYAFFDGISNTYTEAAEIDGASQFRTMVSIIFPLAAKMFLSVALINFVNLWNDYQTLLLYLPTHPTLALGVYYLNSGASSSLVYDNPEVKELFFSETIKMAGCIFLALPIFIVFAIFRDKLMGNMSMGGIKE